jgi:hypothetical protein
VKLLETDDVAAAVRRVPARTWRRSRRRRGRAGGARPAARGAARAGRALRKAQSLAAGGGRGGARGRAGFLALHRTGPGSSATRSGSRSSSFTHRSPDHAEVAKNLGLPLSRRAVSALRHRVAARERRAIAASFSVRAMWNWSRAPCGGGAPRRLAVGRASAPGRSSTCTRASRTSRARNAGAGQRAPEPRVVPDAVGEVEPVAVLSSTLPVVDEAPPTRRSCAGVPSAP